MAEDNPFSNAAASKDMQSGPIIPNEDTSTSRNASDDDGVSSGGSSNDLNLDLDSARGRRALKRAQNRDITLDAQSTGYQSPDIAYQISDRLYAKAARQNADLTDDERALLLSRGDVFGKALANPDSLTIEEMHEVMCWPPPDEMRALVQRATGGALSTPRELVAKAREAIERARLQEDLNDDEVRLIAQRFWDQPPRWVLYWGNDGCPGNEEAISLVCSRLGVDMAVVDTVRKHQARGRTSGGAYLDALVISLRQFQRRLEGGEVGTDEFLTLYSGIVARLKTVRAADGGEARLGGIVDAMARLQDRLELGEVENSELVAINRGYLDSLAGLREESSEARVRARPKPEPSISEIKARPIEDDEDEERVDAVAKSMTDLWVMMERGQKVDKEEFIQLNRDYVGSLEPLRSSDRYLDAILAAMAHLGEQLDQKKVDNDEYIKILWAYLVPLSSFRENRRYCRKAGGAPVFARKPRLLRAAELLFWTDHYANFAALNLSCENLTSEVRRRFDALTESQKQAYLARGYLVSSHDSPPYVMQLHPWVKS